MQVRSGEAEVEGCAHVVIGGVSVDFCQQESVFSAVRARLAVGSPRPLVIGSANLDHIHHFGRHGRSRHLIPPRHLAGDEGAVEWVLLADGFPIVKRGRQLTGTAWPRLTGADLLEPLLALAEAGGHTVGFLGGRPEAHDALRAVIAARFPALSVAGYWSPQRAVLDDVQGCAALAAEVRSAGVDMLVVSLGKPRQEAWIVGNGCGSGAKVLLPFGAAADFMAGQVNRAPGWMTLHGLEWFYRLIVEPRRLARRYLLQGPTAFRQLRHANLGDVRHSALFTGAAAFPPAPGT